MRGGVVDDGGRLTTACPRFCVCNVSVRVCCVCRSQWGQPAGRVVARLLWVGVVVCRVGARVFVRKDRVGVCAA